MTVGFSPRQCKLFMLSAINGSCLTEVCSRFYYMMWWLSEAPLNSSSQHMCQCHPAASWQFPLVTVPSELSGLAAARYKNINRHDVSLREAGTSGKAGSSPSVASFIFVQQPVVRKPPWFTVLSFKDSRASHREIIWRHCASVEMSRPKFSRGTWAWKEARGKKNRISREQRPVPLPFL